MICWKCFNVLEAFARGRDTTEDHAHEPAEQGQRRSDAGQAVAQALGLRRPHGAAGGQHARRAPSTAVHLFMPVPINRRNCCV